MFTRILYPTDFSDVSNKALAYIKKLKEAGTKEVIVLHVIDEKIIESYTLGANWAGLSRVDMAKKISKKFRDEARGNLKAIETKLGKSGFSVDIRIKKGSPFKEILKIEDKEDISLIVMGSHGKSNIKEMLLGSVSESVIRHSKNPVLVVKR